ncbi:hypothetical protein CY34DRAFT_222002 [Suillus luteus UH-Slu-Lm8-n1]|uniref:Uncharacterized protein n=1 Tax=Suillus luteus UH-Slu-Lm8-n1 TaxID=930992 RepID=A0A0D0BCM3_9AGAM|nr:hypothetical protein CY34DRAFT_222002 [Suillus luteus UH-Slu-Lm8-n1]
MWSDIIYMIQIARLALTLTLSRSSSHSHGVCATLAIPIFLSLMHIPPPLFPSDICIWTPSITHFTLLRLSCETPRHGVHMAWSRWRSLSRGNEDMRKLAFDSAISHAAIFFS